MKRLVLKTEWCKGCNVCVEFCPKGVLEVKNGKVYIKDLDSCIQCNTCGKMCPDFAISVENN